MERAVTDISFMIDSLSAGGAEQMLVRLAPAIARRGRSVRVDVLTDRVDPVLVARLEAAGVSVETHGFHRIFDLRALSALVHHFRLNAVRVLHTQLEAADVIGTLLARRLGIPALSTQHVFDDDAGRRSAARTHLQHAILRRFSYRTIAVSSAGRDHLISARGHRPDAVLVIPNGLDLPSVPTIEDRDAARERLDLPPDAAVLACCAVLRPAKGIQRAIEALIELPEVRLLIIGDGPHRAELEQLADRSQVADRVHFLGQRDDVMMLLPAADIFVHPTLQDVLPTVIIEAMACRLPVIASDTGGVPELVVDGSTGVLVPPDRSDRLAEAVRSYLDQPSQRDQHGAAGRARAEHLFTLDTQSDRLISLYDESTSQGREK